MVQCVTGGLAACKGKSNARRVPGCRREQERQRAGVLAASIFTKRRQVERQRTERMAAQTP